jgi:tetratricopeptide (TPR) repeat protein
MSLDDEDHLETYEKLYEQYSKKRRTKAHVQSERKQIFGVPIQTRIDSIPIEFVYDSQFIHYHVTDKDIRELLKTMPQGLVDGLSKIVFCSGMHHQQMPPKDEMYAGPQKDTYIGRIGYEVFENVYRGRCLGTYFGNQKVIRVYGYVYPHNIELFEIVEFYLRVQTLLVFLHELAHHYDFEQRAARGRWRQDNLETVEIYAEQMAHQWINDYALPYICKNFADEYAELNNWMEKHIGIPLNLSLLAGDYRGTGKKGRIRMCSFFNTADDFADFVTKVQSQADLTVARVELADDLHMAGEYEVSLEILDVILKEDKKNLRALCVCGEVYWHLEDYSQAIEYAEKVLSLHKQEVDAYRLLCDSYQSLKDWNAVLKWACCGLDYTGCRNETTLLLQHKIQAELELDNLVQAESTLSEIKLFYKGRTLPKRFKGLEKELRNKQRKGKLCSKR